MPGSSHWCSRHRDEALVRGKKQNPGPPQTLAHQRGKSVYDVRLRLGDHLMAKTTPFLMLRTIMMSAMSEASPVRRRQGEGGDSAGQIDESGQGPKRAVAEAVACPLRIQPCMYSNTIESSSKRPVARARCSYISYALRPVSQAVGRRRCRSPKVDGGRLQKAAPEALLARKKGFTGPSTTLAAVKLQRSLPRASCTVHCRLYM